MKTKKLLASSAAVLLTALSLHAADVRNGLVAYWPMNTAPGSGSMTTPDVVAANDLVGPLKDGDTALVAGRHGNAVTFTGSTSDYLYLLPVGDTGLPVAKQGSWSYCVWVNGAGSNQVDQSTYFAETISGGSTQWRFGMESATNTAKTRTIIRDTSGVLKVNAVLGNTNTLDSTWHHIAYTYDISTSRFMCYVDGQPVSTNTFTYAQNAASFNQIGVGALVRATVAVPFTGAVDDLALWARPLSQGEIQDVMTNSIATPVPAFAPTVTVNPIGATNLLEGDSFTLSGLCIGTRPFSYQWVKDGTNYPGPDANALTLSSMTTNDNGLYQLVFSNAGGSATSTVAQVTVNAFGSPNLTNGMVAYWPLDATTGVKTPDLVSAYDMTLINMGGSNLVSGKWGNALSFNKTFSQYTRRAHAPGEALPANSVSNFTVSFWAKAPAAAGGWAFAEGNTAGGNPAFALGMNASDARFYWLTRNAAGTLFAGYSVASVWDDNWHHIAWVQRVSGSTLKAQLYIDGVLDAATLSTSFPLGVNNSALGAYYRTSPTLPITGLVDEVAVWQRALSPAEITALQTSYITNPPIRITPLVISSFKSDLPAVAQGDSTVLRWDVPSNADTVSIVPIGDVTGKTVSGVGSTNVSPGSTTAYVLTVTRTTGIFGTEIVKATNVIGVVAGVAANWSLLDNFDFYSPGGLASNGWWTDVGTVGGPTTVSVVTPTNCNRLVKTLTTASGAYLKLNALTVNSNQSRTLFFRMIPTATDTAATRNYVGITDRPGNFQYQYTGGNIGPALYPTINDASQNPGDWLLAARDIPYSALTFDTNVLATGAVYNVWIDITNVFIGDRIFPDNYDMFSVHLQKEGDPGRTTVFTNFTSDRDLLFDDLLTGGQPTDPLTRIYLCGSRTDYSALFDDFYLSKSGYNATIPRAVGYAGAAPTLALQWSGSQWQVVFQGKLLEATSVTGTWTEVSGATSPYPVTTTGGQKFYRAVCY